MNTRTFLALLCVGLGLSLTACGDGASDNAGDTAGDVATTATDSAADDADAPETVETYESRGKVVKVDTERNRITLDHEQIGDWMEPMTMPFRVADSVKLDGIEVGRTYRFSIEVTGGEKYHITQLTAE